MMANIDFALWNYVIYLIVSLAVTCWVGRTLYKNGRVFLVDAFGQNHELADSVNHLLLVGFYLINFGYVCLALRTSSPPRTHIQLFEHLSTKIGVVLLVLGVIHTVNVIVFNKMRTQALG